MGSSNHHMSLNRLLFILLLCPLYSWGATVGLLVESDSGQAQSFKKHLLMLVPEQEIQIFTPDDLDNELQVARWLTIGPKALSSLLANKHFKQPILALFTKHDSVTKLRHAHPNRVFSVLDNTPTLDRQLALVKVLNPQAQRVSVFYSSQSQYQLTGLKTLANSLDFQLITTELTDPLNWKRDALKALKDSDLVLGLNDRAIYNATNIRSLLMRLYRAGKPLVGPDKGYVRAGAVASVYSGVQETLAASADLLKSKEAWPAIIYNPYFKISINAQVARSLNIVVGSEEQVGMAVRELLP